MNGVDANAISFICCCRVYFPVVCDLCGVCVHLFQSHNTAVSARPTKQKNPVLCSSRDWAAIRRLGRDTTAAAAVAGHYVVIVVLGYATLVVYMQRRDAKMPTMTMMMMNAPPPPSDQRLSKTHNEMLKTRGKKKGGPARRRRGVSVAHTARHFSVVFSACASHPHTVVVVVVRRCQTFCARVCR